jgi:hypothetical protein
VTTAGRRIRAFYPRGVRFAGGTLALLIVGALLAGCGSSYTKHDFIASADAICASTVRQTRAIAPPSFTGSKSQQLKPVAAYLAAVLPLVQAEASRLRALRRPTGNARDRADLERYLRALAQAVGDYRDLAAAARRSDPQGVARAEADLRRIPVAALAATYGLRSCGTPGATVA